MSKALNSTDLKTFRISLNLSQANVSKKTGLNRSYLSQFESGKRLLSDKDCQMLLDFYRSQGLEESAVPDVTIERAVKQRKIRLVDGIQITPGMEESLVETLFARFYANEGKLKTLLNLPIKPSLLGDESNVALENISSQEALFLIVDNYSILKQLRGEGATLTSIPENGAKLLCRHYLKLKSDDLLNNRNVDKA